MNFTLDKVTQVNLIVCICNAGTPVAYKQCP